MTIKREPEVAGRDLPTHLEAVLFDMDGTLTDSEPLWATAMAEVTAAMGGEFTDELRNSLVGAHMRASVEKIHAALGLEQDWRATATALNDRVAVLYRDGVPWRPGAQQLLAEVRAAGLRTALVTSTERSLVEVALDTLGAHHFDVVVAGDDVTHGKPDPESYRTALTRLGVDTAAAVAIEDSPTGTEAAIAAGLRVLVVPSEVPVPTGDRRTHVESLSGITVAQLRTLLTADIAE